ncbi:hypothetical protein ABZW03_24800 [Kitasatospora sp. NPDC004799]|uniref:hypothetical protein n=1 Tax=Kitasatospora sp. NPDC004799 TaxID=3154460 RepID=UPI0033B5DF8E
MVDAVRISRPTDAPVPHIGIGLVGPTPATTIREGNGAVLPAHGLAAVEHLVDEVVLP